MNDFEIDIVLSRLTKMKDYLKRLEGYESITLKEYVEDQDSQLITERLIQVITEAALDVTKHLLSCLGVLQQRDSWTNKDYFLEAQKQGILSEEIAQELARAAGMRNILVHAYLNIEPNQVFFAIGKCLAIYPVYMRQVMTYLDS